MADKSWVEDARAREVLMERMGRSLTNITPTGQQIQRIERVRKYAKRLGEEIVYACPVSREQSLALTHLEETVMWAVKSIVLEGGQD